MRIDNIEINPDGRFQLSLNLKSLKDNHLFIGKNVSFGMEVDLRETSIICDNVIIGDYINIGEDVLIGNHVKIGNDVILRNDIEIGNHVKIGNHVIIGNHVKIGDDAIIGNNVRISDYGIIFDGTNIKEGSKIEGKITDYRLN